MVAIPWITRCCDCGCRITVRAVEERKEGVEPIDLAPKNSIRVTCSCCWRSAQYEPVHIFQGMPEPNMACPRIVRASKVNDRVQHAAMLIASSIVASVRLNKEKIQSNPVVLSAIAESVQLATMVAHRLRNLDL